MEKYPVKNVIITYCMEEPYGYLLCWHDIYQSGSSDYREHLLSADSIEDAVVEAAKFLGISKDEVRIFL